MHCQSDSIQITQATFEEIHPGHGNHYSKHPMIIKKYLEETTRHHSIKKGLKIDFHCSSKIIFQIKRVQDMVWAWDIKLLLCSTG